MAIEDHPMTRLRGTNEGRALMLAVREHRKAAVAKPALQKKKAAADVEDAADAAAEPGGEPANEKGAAVNFMNKRRKAAASTKN